MEGTEGSSDDHPIVIPELSMNMFELFLSVAYSSWKPEGPTHDDVVDLLRFSNKFMSQKARDKFFVPTFRRLIEFRVRNIPGPVRKRLGFEVWNAFVDLKELLDEHRRIVACEEPPIIEHSPYCTDNTTCSIDWRQLWWNSMAHFLLDGRNPQYFREAVERFQELGSEIGRMNPECWKILLQTVKKGAAFHLTVDLVEETAQQLSAALITEPGPMLTRAELDTLGLPSQEIL
ncbi:hypothetical protein DEU56DRAFT_912594 [Suillus clintonianus]|uniref:uncharacterized protein n=1 Tax=Suillus clintonianus TaxID=1904413 RepID=UPI001B85C9FE|nr:uncharacterized protein DEU56DRAFT_912594 [Suillus clintonianus]KAG2137957.1 hypothetical protein DEU56DRAFT_912594 [Suillus clintonianus]